VIYIHWLTIFVERMTLPLVVALREFDREQRLAVNALFADPEPEDGLIVRVVEATEACGGISYAKAKAREFADQALAAIDDLPESDAANALAGAVNYTVERRQ